MKSPITITLVGMLLLPLAAAAQPAPPDDQEKQEKQDEQKIEAKAKAAAAKAKAEASRVAERAKAEAQRAKGEAERALAGAKAQAHAFTLSLGRKTEKAAYLGVSTSPVTPALREQLKLPKGIGLVIDFVEPDSPAAAAGIKEYDVIQKLDDQLLINNHQLAVLVRRHNGGDSVTLSVVHQGQPGTVTAKLVEKEVAVLDDNNPWGTPPEMWRMPPMPPVKAVPFGQFKDFKATTTRPANRPARVGERSEHSENLFINPDGSGVRVVVPHPDAAAGWGRTAVMRMADGRQVITLDWTNDHKHLVATDADGHVRFDGPVDTEEQRNALPADLRVRLNEIELDTPPAIPAIPAPPAAPPPPVQPAPPAPPAAPAAPASPEPQVQ